MIKCLSSTRFTLIGMGLLAIGAALSYDNPVTTPVWVLVMPLLLLAINLLLAIVSNPAINRRGGLLLFHIGLLAVITLAAIGRLTHMEAHIELVDGNSFTVDELFDVDQGPWHGGSLDKVHFMQGPWSVNYRAGMRRGLTHSTVLLPDGRGGWRRQVIGDDRPLLAEGYRIYATSNKGFAPLLTWIPDDGVAISGTVNMPSYPLNYFRQTNEWTPPGAKPIKFWLQLDTGMNEHNSWTLDPEHAMGLLIVNAGGQRLELRPGESLRLTGGLLRYEHLSSWMGYKVFYDPTLSWLFICAILAVMGLALHYWRKFSAQPLLLDSAKADILPEEGVVKAPSPFGRGLG